MILSISNKQSPNFPASDFSYLLAKNPKNFHAFNNNFGKIYCFFSEHNENNSKCNLLIDVDAIDIVRSDSTLLTDYVNDRPFASGSIFTAGISRCFRSALTGNCKDRPELISEIWPLEIEIATLKSPKGLKIIHELFEPLGYIVETKSRLFDDNFPEWGESPYFNVKLCGSQTAQALFQHLFILISVLDNEKHYVIAKQEVEKLLHHSKTWLNKHPLKEFIISRYLKHLKELKIMATEGLKNLSEEVDDLEDEEENILFHADPRNDDKNKSSTEFSLEKKTSLYDHRFNAVFDALKSSGAQTVCDLGCAGGQFVSRYVASGAFSRVGGMDISQRAIFRLRKMIKPKDKNIDLFVGSLTYFDRRLLEYEALTLVEVIEHFEPWDLEMVEKVIFGATRPKTVIVTTPNFEYNQVFGMAPNKLRHTDHKFEFTRAEFQKWCEKISSSFGYEMSSSGIGDNHLEFGQPSQMCVFKISEEELTKDEEANKICFCPKLDVGKLIQEEYEEEMDNT